MTLFMKQDFTPPILSRKWIAMKLRPNIQLHSLEHIVAVLESGLLFREDSAEVEQGAPSPHEVWVAAGGVRGGWLTRGERAASVLAVVACAVAWPPRGLQRCTLAHLSAVCALPLATRAALRRAGRRGGAALARLLARMRAYLTLARRAAACLQECRALHKDLESVTSAVDSTLALLCRQQRELWVLLARAAAALLGNAPWLPADLPWDAGAGPDSDLTKIHHAFLVIQSILLKYIAMSHFIPSRQAQQLYVNHNERLYWLHTVLIPHISEEFQQNHEDLERMYRLLKNYGNLDVNIVKKPGFAINDSWLYSEVHNGVARSSLELKVLLGKCVRLDMFLDSCALNKQEIDLDVLNRDIEDLIDGIGKCLNTVQASQLRLKKMQYKIDARSERKVENNNDASAVVMADSNVTILKIEDKEPESKDEVFYFMKTEDDETGIQPAADVTTAPGKKEKDATKVVLSELKRKLVKREDLMRERERQALVNTMPELKGNLPEFPRQLPTELFEKKGFITKINKLSRQRNLSKRKASFKRVPKGQWKFANTKRSYVFSPKPETSDKETVNYEAKLSLKNKLKTLLTIKPVSKRKLQISKWFKQNKDPTAEKFSYKSKSESSVISDDFVEIDDVVIINQAINRATNQATNDATNEAKNTAKTITFTKKELESSLSSSDTDWEQHKEQMQLLKDVRRHRVTRKKNHPAKRGSITVEDEGLKPVEYSFGTGMAIASVLQIDKGNRPSFSQEEVFIGDGEVSEDSGNDDDA